MTSETASPGLDSLGRRWPGERPRPTATSLAGYEMEAAGQPLRRVVKTLRPLEPDEVLLRVAGCGVCHTDLGFLYGGVRTRHSAPLILGHEISGHIEDAGHNAASRIGEAVVVPAVLPCRACALCLAGRSMICRAQVMPGNDCDGGFATHVILPARDLCRVPGAGEDADSPVGSVPGLTLRHLAVVADAVSTAYQAVARSGLTRGDLAIVVGLGGVGGYAAQIAADRGAAVAGIDPDPRRLEAAAAAGTGLVLDPRDLPGREIKARISEFARWTGAPETGWTILECSGTAAGEKAAFGLLVPGATLVVVGFTLESIEIRLANLMAFDARALGNWGCAPELYPEILEKVLAGKIDVLSNTELRPLAQIEAALEEVRNHRVSRRLVLTPDAGEEVS
jgi:6-hydroxycyclohex-1-ene-1-carbonyl-CoA dehydrogenase